MKTLLKIAGVFVAVIFVLVAIALTIGSRLDSPDSGKSANTTSDSSTPKAATSPSQPKPDPFAANWNYDERTDKMSDKITREAGVDSSNTVDFDFPYNGGSRASLCFRNSPRYGNDAYLEVTRGQFLCNSFDGCSVRIRVGSGSAVAAGAGEPSDGRSDVVFIHARERLLASAKSGDHIKIEAPFYQEGNRVFEFDLRGFDPKRLSPKK